MRQVGADAVQYASTPDQLARVLDDLVGNRAYRQEWGGALQSEPDNSPGRFRSWLFGTTLRPRCRRLQKNDVRVHPATPLITRARGAITSIVELC